MVFEPTYALHSHIARLTATPLVAGRRDDEFRIDPGEVVSHRGALGRRSTDEARPAVSFLCSPNNPTGALETTEALRAVARHRHRGSSSSTRPTASSRRGRLSSSSASEPRLVVLRTFSKTWAMAGLRLGYAVADPSVVAAMSNVALPYHLDALKQAAGRLALRLRRTRCASRVAATVEERGRLVDGPRATSGSRYGPRRRISSSFASPRVDGPEVWNGCSTTPCSSATSRTGPGSRAACASRSGTRSENDRFLVWPFQHVLSNKG